MSFRNFAKFSLIAGTSVLAAGCATMAPPMDSTPRAEATSPFEPVVAPAAQAHPDRWPVAHSPAAITDARTEAQITALLKAMTLEQKIGQLIQADISTITPADLAQYPLGSILAGGNSGPYGDERASAAQWDKLVKEFRVASMQPAANGIGIPILFGVDAVHGHNNIPNATVYPHNIGLGAAHDPELIFRIGKATAAEIAGSGIEWTFAPTLAVPQDDRWGRTYEGYSSDPATVAEYSKQMVLGLQGPLVAGQTLTPEHVAATAKHFLADGGTAKGKDQGDAQISEAELIRIHNAGYPPAIDAGVLTVMASFSSWNGVKNHGNTTLLTDVLKDRMGFEGLVVGDWNGHGQIDGCEATDCPQALLAGLDLYMAPDSWKGLYDSMLAHAKAGHIPMVRLDDAVRRIMRVKFKLGLMDNPPESRTNLSAMGAPAHLAIAREAVAKSLVLLKNQGSVLPLKPGAKVLVTGPGADSMAMQNGGWTVSWQGDDVTHADFTNGQTIWEGLREAVDAAGGKAMLSADGTYSAKPDVAVVVFGEKPYAEFQGDRPDYDYRGAGLAQIEALKAKGIPVVAVFLSGRPMFVNPEIAASDAFVAAWLPGTQGAGLADVLVAQANGKPKRDFTGSLSFAWPAGCEPGSPDMLPLRWGSSYAAPRPLPTLNTECSLDGQSGAGLTLYDRGVPAGIESWSGDNGIANLAGNAPGFKATAFDVGAQEDARRLVWSAPAALRFKFEGREFPEGAALAVTYQVANRPTGPFTLAAMGAGASSTVDLTQTLSLAEGKGWRTMEIPVKCLANGAVDGFLFNSQAAFTLDLQKVSVVPQSANTDCTGPF